MKKIIIVVVVGLLVPPLAGGNSANAQNKSGYISIENMVGLMPEIAKIDSTLQKFQVDSLNAELQILAEEFNRKDSLLHRNKDSLAIPPAIRNRHRQDIQNITLRVQNWEAYTNQELGRKQNELLAPVYRKVHDAIQAVAKENGYVYVFSTEALIVAPPGDDLLLLVAKKLNVKLPPQAVAPR